MPDKAALLAAVVEQVFATFPSLPLVADWQTQVRAFARAYCDLARAHPDLIRYLIVDVVSPLATVAVANEQLYAALAQAGLAPAAIVQAADLIVDYLHGFLLAEQAMRADRAAEHAAVQRTLAAHPPDRLPTLRRVFAALSVADLQADYESGLDFILTGISARSAADRPLHP